MERIEISAKIIGCLALIGCLIGVYMHWLLRQEVITRKKEITIV